MKAIRQLFNWNDPKIITKAEHDELQDNFVRTGFCRDRFAISIELDKTYNPSQGFDNFSDRHHRIFRVVGTSHFGIDQKNYSYAHYKISHPNTWYKLINKFSNVTFLRMIDSGNFLSLKNAMIQINVPFKFQGHAPVWITKYCLYRGVKCDAKQIDTCIQLIQINGPYFSELVSVAPRVYIPDSHSTSFNYKLDKQATQHLQKETGKLIYNNVFYPGDNEVSANDERYHFTSKVVMKKAMGYSEKSIAQSCNVKPTKVHNTLKSIHSSFQFHYKGLNVPYKTLCQHLHNLYVTLHEFSP